jgi:hypothetical protein
LWIHDFGKCGVGCRGSDPAENGLQGAKLFGRNRLVVTIGLDLVFVATALERPAIALHVEYDVSVLKLAAASCVNVGVTKRASLNGLGGVVLGVERAGWLGGSSAHLIDWLVVLFSSLAATGTTYEILAWAQQNNNYFFCLTASRQNPHSAKTDGPGYIQPRAML